MLDTLSLLDDDGVDLEVLFLGTGTSSTVPAIHCLTDPDNGCLCCRSTLQPGGERNKRRNTAAVIRVKAQNQAERTILIDAGKSMYAAAVEWFPKHGLRRLDAVLLTHPHADAMNGLDDLRGWTLGGAIQKHLDVYCNQQTFVEIKRAFPYLVSKDFATGGGDLPEFVWHIIENDKIFELCGLTVTPLPVHHGKFFTTGEPYLCLGFLFNRRIAYLSDVSKIPDEIMAKLVPTEQNAAIDVLVIDVLRIPPHASHFGIGQAMQATRLIQPARTYLTGFAHRATHEAWLHLCKAIEAGRGPTLANGSTSQGFIKAHQYEKGERTFADDDLEAYTQSAFEEMGAWEGALGESIWVRPSFDGLKITLPARGPVRDDEDA